MELGGEGRCRGRGGVTRSGRVSHLVSMCRRFLVQFKQDKVCVKFIQGAAKNGNSASCRRKNNRLLEVLVPSTA